MYSVWKGRYMYAIHSGGEIDTTSPIMVCEQRILIVEAT